MASLCGIDGCGKKSLRYGDAEVNDGKPNFRPLCSAHYRARAQEAPAAGEGFQARGAHPTRQHRPRPRLGDSWRKHKSKSHLRPAAHGQPSPPTHRGTAHSGGCDLPRPQGQPRGGKRGFREILLLRPLEARACCRLPQPGSAPFLHNGNRLRGLGPDIRETPPCRAAPLQGSGQREAPRAVHGRRPPLPHPRRTWTSVSSFRAR